MAGMEIPASETAVAAASSVLRRRSAASTPSGKASANTTAIAAGAPPFFGRAELGRPAGDIGERGDGQRAERAGAAALVAGAAVAVRAALELAPAALGGLGSAVAHALARAVQRHVADATLVVAA